MFKSKLKQKTLSGQSREIVANVIQFMTHEAKGNKVLLPLNKIQERVALGVGVSIKTVQRIVSESKDIKSGKCVSYSTPNKKRVRKAVKSKLEDFDKSELRRLVINFIVTEKKVPTLRNILKIFSDYTKYNGSHESLRLALRKLGFRFRKTKSNRKILMERNHIRLLRIRFLRNMIRFRADNRPIIYMDETYILHKPTGKDSKFIIVHAGGENGFVKNAYLKLKSNSKTGENHNEMNFDIYKKWLEEKLIPNLPPKSVLVIDNAPYHNVQIDKWPRSNSTKDEMKSWLIRKNLSFTDDMLKPELHFLIKLNKPQYKTYEIDKLLLDKGHNVLRLPPYHSDLNPIELVWTSLKQYIAAKNATTPDTETFCDEFFETFSAEEWKLHCDQVKAVEEFYMRTESIVDDVVDEFIISLGVDSDSETSDSDISDNESTDLDELN